MGIEVEIKLNLPDAAIALLQRHPLLQNLAKAPTESRLISTYFDTPDNQLRKLGYALRIRQEGAKFIQTLKGRATMQAGIPARSEWEWPLSHFALDFSVIHLPKLQTLFQEPSFTTQITPRFITDFVRVIWNMQLSDNTLIEVALDRGEILAPPRSSPIQELELELKSGNPETLKAVAGLFEVELGLKPELRSKAARGFALC